MASFQEINWSYYVSVVVINVMQFMCQVMCTTKIVLDNCSLEEHRFRCNSEACLIYCAVK